MNNERHTQTHSWIIAGLLVSVLPGIALIFRALVVIRLAWAFLSALVLVAATVKGLLLVPCRARDLHAPLLRTYRGTI